MPRVDLHSHSTASDGSLSPTELVALARERGVEILALTDHDTLDGLNEALSAGEDCGVCVVPGVELSVDWEESSLHLLGYGFDHRNDALNRTLADLAESRCVRNVKIIGKLNEAGFSVTLEELRRKSPRGVLGRAHIAQHLVETRQLPTYEEAFNVWIGKGKRAYVDRMRLSLGTACELLHSAGGAAVWAHPGLHFGRLDRMFARLPGWREMGLDGLESDYSAHSRQLRDRLRAIATENGLIWTGGSDFHGDVRPAVMIGDGPEGDAIDYECWTNLDERLRETRAASSTSSTE